MRAKKTRVTDTAAGDEEADDALLADIWGFACATKSKSSSSGLQRGGSVDDWADDEQETADKPSSSNSSTMKQPQPKGTRRAIGTASKPAQQGSSPPVKKQKLGGSWITSVQKMQIDVDTIITDLAGSPTAELGAQFSGLLLLLCLSFKRRKSKSKSRSHVVKICVIPIALMKSRTGWAQKLSKRIMTLAKGFEAKLEVSKVDAEEQSTQHWRTAQISWAMLLDVQHFVDLMCPSDLADFEPAPALELMEKLRKAEIKIGEEWSRAVFCCHAVALMKRGIS